VRAPCATTAHPAETTPDPELLDSFDAITDDADAERASAITCELCGKPGMLRGTRYWAKTLCPTCARPARIHTRVAARPGVARHRHTAPAAFDPDNRLENRSTAGDHPQPTAEFDHDSDELMLKGLG
jgi:hypothetical protein